MTEHKSPVLICLFALVTFTATFANACDVMIGDWKLTQGDVSKVERVNIVHHEASGGVSGALSMFDPQAKKPIIKERPSEFSGLDITLSSKVVDRFAQLTRSYANPVKDVRLPIIAGKIKIEPRVKEPILDGRITLEAAKDADEADKLVKTFESCK